MSESGVPPIVSDDVHRVQRIPPRQALTRKWPVLHAGSVPPYAYYDSLGDTLGPMPADWRAEWKFGIWGLVEQGWECNYYEFVALPHVDVHADMHCVTRWSKLDNVWEGVATQTVIDKVKVRPEAKFVMVHCENGFTTNLPLADFLGADCLFAWKHNGQPLEPDHGYPLRLVIPRLYAWKSAKWVRGIELLAEDRAGFWESWEHGGYHMRGDTWAEQRFR
ncbi:oxidoreductase [Planctomycetaceae bacterium SCGC AG-212-F19]|nr:oxidoreductase [Planctomycetaceae bacterium SCGC AG-212-F19]